MSIRVMTWVWEHSEARGIDRLVLLAIADHAEDHGGNAYPSVRHLSEKAKVTARTVQRSIVALVELGELAVRRNAGRAGANMYRVVMNAPRTDVTPPSESHPRTDVTPVPQSPRTGDTAPPVPKSPPPRTAVTQTVLEPSVNRPSSAKADEAPRPDVERICKRLADKIEANGSKRPEITQRWRTEARLLLDRDGRTVDQVERAIDWCQSDAFWRANVLSMPKLREKYDQLRLAAKRPSRESDAQERVIARARDPLGSAR